MVRKQATRTVDLSAISDQNAQIVGDANFGRWRRTVTQWDRWKVLRKRKKASLELHGSDSDSSDSDRLPDLISSSEDEIDVDHTPVGNRIDLNICAGADSSQTMVAGGIKGACPAFYRSLMSRLGTKTRLAFLLTFIVADCAKFMTSEWISPGSADNVNLFSVVVAQDFVSFTIATVASLALEGRQAVGKLISWGAVWRFLLISAFFTTGSMCNYFAYDAGASAAAVATIGTIYLPFAAALSFLVMKRHYGKLEWLSLSIIMLAVSTFILLRERARNGGAHFEDKLTQRAFFYILVSVFLGVIASILAERIFKDRSFGLIRHNNGQRRDKFYIHKAHLDFASLLIGVSIWLAPENITKQWFPKMTSGMWFGDWGSEQAIILVVAVCQSWLAGILTKHFSTVIKCVAQTLSSVIVILVLDPLVMKSWVFESGELAQVVKAMLATIIVFATFIFQTGRLNVRQMKKLMGLKRREIIAAGVADLGWVASWKAIFSPPRWEWIEPFTESRGIDGRSDDAELSDDNDTPPTRSLMAGSRPSSERPSAPQLDSQRTEKSNDEEDASADEDEEAEVVGSRSQRSFFSDKTFIKEMIMYSSMVFFIFSDAGRTLSQQAALSTTPITPISMVLACFICGVAIAASLTVYTDGWPGLKLAFNLWKTLECIPCAFFFAVSSTLLSLAYAEGISAALATVLGYIYMPFSALASRWVLGKFYMWLEWLALIILTLACCVFGALQHFYSGSANGVGGAESPFAMLLVVFSAISSVFGSLVAEKILKKESLPFHIQKVRLDMGSTMTTLFLLPVVGTVSRRAKDGFWKERVMDLECERTTNYCSPQSQSPYEPVGCANAFCAEMCGCSSGLFVGWSSRLVLLALLLNVLQGWLGGKVAKKFSTVMRAIAQSCSLIVIYFAGDMIMKSNSVHDISMTLIAFIVPLSTCVFLVAVGEMEKVMRLTAEATKGT